MADKDNRYYEDEREDERAGQSYEPADEPVYEDEAAQGDAPEAFTDTVIMYEVLSELKEIAARPRGITCACGSERYRMQVRPAAVDLICEDCGAKLRIGAATDEDLDRLCCRMTLQIPGKKG